MRFYATADINHYWELPTGWSLYCHTPLKTWHRRPLQAKHIIAHWRDLKGAKLPVITHKDLYLKEFPISRIRPEACLPWYYCVGNRFIRLERAFPAGFKCVAVPMNLKEVRDFNSFRKQTRRSNKQNKRLRIK